MREGATSGLLVARLVLTAVMAVTHSAQAQTGSGTQVGRVYGSSEVDAHARSIDDGTRPVYPDSLQKQGVGGRVVAQFVVDTLGRADTASIMTDAPQPLFAAAVRNTLARMHFTPASKDGHLVAEEIEKAFTFRADDPAPLTAESVLQMLRGRRGTPARLTAASSFPRYPERARRMGVEALVNAEFIVDSTGRLVIESFRVIAVSSWETGSRGQHECPRNGAPDFVQGCAIPLTPNERDQLFVDAVRAALPSLRFVPAQFNGRNASQFASMPFSFTIKN